MSTTISLLAAPGTTRPVLSSRSLVVWRTLQVAVWFVGAAIVLALVIEPEIGIHAFWNVLIPVAPALLAVAPGLWRNVCPLGSTALVARHMNWTRSGKISRVWHGRLAAGGVFLLLLIVPLRHVILDTSGLATALTISLLALLAVVLGSQLQWKSAWCSGLCPVHPVEKLYGSEPIASFANAHCHRCERCVTHCPDSTPGISPILPSDTGLGRLPGIVMVGGFVGFIWGWFQVPDYAGAQGWHHLDMAYGWPFAGLAASMSLFLMLRLVTPRKHRVLLHRLFAAAAISCYYWYRLPALAGFGPHPGDGMLVDLRATLPAWSPVASRVVTTAFFVWWLVMRRSAKRSWLVRPAFVNNGVTIGINNDHKEPMAPA